MNQKKALEVYSTKIKLSKCLKKKEIDISLRGSDSLKTSSYGKKPFLKRKSISGPLIDINKSRKAKTQPININMKTSSNINGSTGALAKLAFTEESDDRISRQVYIQITNY